MTHLRSVVLLGAAGGVLTWLSGFFYFGAEPRFSVFVDPFVSMLLGAGAGVIYVFLLANTDRSDQPRLLALALLAGFCWEPVLRAGSALIERQRDREVVEKAQAVTREAIDLARTLSTAPSDQRELLVGELRQKLDETEILSAQIQSVSGLQRVTAVAQDLALELDKLPAEPAIEALRKEAGAVGAGGGFGRFLERSSRLAAPVD